jgi:hypothetical protein
MAAGASGGALGAALYGGTIDDVLSAGIKGAVIGGASAAVFYGVGSYFQEARDAQGALTTSQEVESIAAHGVLGGAKEAAEGGDFWNGFVATAVTKASSVWGPRFEDTAANFSRAAVVGGTVAAMTGGKFANGAVLGAFSYGFNDYVHEQYEKFERFVAGLPSIPQGVSNAVQGFGSGLSFGGTDKINEWLGAGGFADKSSPEFAYAKDIGRVWALSTVAEGAAAGYAAGREIRIGDNFRFAPFGNRRGSIGEYPHYHRRVVDPETGSTIPGGA